MSVTPARATATFGHPNEASFGFSQATVDDGLIYVAGQVARDDGPVLEGLDLEGKHRKSVQNVEAAVAQLRSGRPGAAWAQVFTTASPASLTHDPLWTGPAPALSVVQVPHLNAVDFEIEVTAVAEEADMHRESIEGNAVDRALGRPAGLRIDRQIMLSGHLSVTPDGHPIEGTFAEHFAAALDALLATAAGLGAEPEDLVWLQYLTPVAPSADVFRGAVSEIHRARFPGPNRPATSLIGVTSLAVPGAQVEVTGFGVLPRA